MVEDHVCHASLISVADVKRKYATVKSEITADKSSDLQAVKRLATYLHRASDR